MTQRPSRRDLARSLSVDWSPGLAARVRRRLDGALARRRSRRRTVVLTLGLLVMGGVSYAFWHVWRAPRLEPGPAAASPSSRPSPPLVSPASSAPSPTTPSAPPPATPTPPRPATGARRPPATQPAHATSLPETVDSLFAAADAARLQGRPRDAVGPLTAVFTRFASDPRAAVAAFQLGRVLDDDLHDPAGAAAAFARAMALDPRGPLAADAAARARAALDRATAGAPRP